MSYKHILVAVDLSESSQIVIDRAIKQAKDANSKLSFAYVNVDRVVVESKDESDLRKALQTLANKSDYPITEIFVEVGDLHVKLSSIVEDEGIDLVVCGHHHGFLSRLFSPLPKLADAVKSDLLVVYLEE